MASRKAIVYHHTQLALGALAQNAVVVSQTPIDSARENGFRVDKIRYAIEYRNKTDTEGPIQIGLSKQDVSAADIAAALVADPQGQFDTDQNQVTDRAIMPMAMITRSGTSSPAEIGLVHYRSVNWPWKRIEEGEGLNWWAANRDGTTLTTGCSVLIFGSYIGEWMRD